VNSLILKVEVVAGTDFEDAVEDAKKLSSMLGDSVKFVQFAFNGRLVLVSEGSDTKAMFLKYEKGREYVS
jgi:hypothetical protein